MGLYVYRYQLLYSIIRARSCPFNILSIIDNYLGCKRGLVYHMLGLVFLSLGIVCNLNGLVYRSVIVVVDCRKALLMSPNSLNSKLPYELHLMILTRTHWSYPVMTVIQNLFQ